MNILLAGCSFTENSNSWAWCSIPEQYDGRMNSPEQLLKDEWNWWVKKQIGNIDPTYNTNVFWDHVKKLPNVNIKVIGESSGSNTLIARKVINEIENNKIDAVVFQITGLERNEVLSFDKKFIERYFRDCNFGEGVTIEDVTYLKQDASTIEFLQHRDEQDPQTKRFLKACANFYLIQEQEEIRIKNIEALQSLTMICKLKNISLKYFWGWDNQSQPSQFFKNKFNTYVKPYMLEHDNLLQYAKNNLDPSLVFTIDDAHPHSVAHRLYWNDVVFPHLSNLDK